MSADPVEVTLRKVNVLVERAYAAHGDANEQRRANYIRSAAANACDLDKADALPDEPMFRALAWLGKQVINVDILAFDKFK
jgi:hypothetical protein